LPDRPKKQQQVIAERKDVEFIGQPPKEEEFHQ